MVPVWVPKAPKPPVFAPPRPKINILIYSLINIVSFFSLENSPERKPPVACVAEPSPPAVFSVVLAPPKIPPVELDPPRAERMPPALPNTFYLLLEQKSEPFR